MHLRLMVRPGASAFHGRGMLVAAMVVDSIGTGLFLPFVVVYFLHTTTLPLAVIGASLSAAALAALPTPVLVGVLIDRFGALQLVAGGNIVSAVAFLAYLVVGSTWQLMAAAFVAGVGQATFWTATRALVGVIVESNQRALVRPANQGPQRRLWSGRPPRRGGRQCGNQLGLPGARRC